MRFCYLPLCALLVSYSAFAQVEEEKTPDYNGVVLQGLNKVTGHILKFEGELYVPVRFGNLEITARRCWKSPPEEQPENAALLEINELKPDEEAKRIFLGWMFSSSPGLSGLEHPVYDITVLDCEMIKREEKQPAEPEKPTQKERPAEKTEKKKVKKQKKK